MSIMNSTVFSFKSELVRAPPEKNFSKSVYKATKLFYLLGMTLVALKIYKTGLLILKFLFSY